MREHEHLRQYYANYDEENRLTSPHGRVEFLTTMRYIEKYLKPGMRILEIGAGTGRYTHALARMGYEVDAVELVETNLELLRRNTQPSEKIRAWQGDALDLSGLTGETYDIVLLLGPMYHLYSEEDKLRALSEALRAAKTGGLLFTAYCMTDASIIGFGFQGGHMRELFDKELLDPATFAATSTPLEVFELVRKEDIDALMSHFDVERLHFVATDLYTNYMRPCVDAMDEETFALYLRYHFVICERGDMVGVSHHTLDVVRKK